MKTKYLLLAASLIGSMAITETKAQLSVTACNGKIYSKGDTLIIGNPSLSGYLFMRTLDEQGNVSSVSGHDIAGTKVVITSVPEYSKKLYESMGIYEQPESPQIVIAEGEGKRFSITLNESLCRGNIMSDYKVSAVDGATNLTPSILYVYALKLYNTPINKEVIDTYASLCNYKEFDEASSDPFALEELRNTYQAKLNNELKNVDFSKVFRIKCLSELQPYDINKGCFPLSGFSCVDVKTKQQDELRKLGYCLWEECAFHFTNTSQFLLLKADRNRAKALYDMRRYAQKPSHDTPMATLYVYVKIKKQPVKLPEKKIMVFSKGDRFDYTWETLSKAYGKKSLDMDIIRIDGYNNLLPHVEGEVVYNYIGSTVM